MSNNLVKIIPVSLSPVSTASKEQLNIANACVELGLSYRIERLGDRDVFFVFKESPSDVEMWSAVSEYVGYIAYLEKVEDVAKVLGASIFVG